MHYTHPTHLSTPIGNNALSYEERISAWSKGELYVPALIKGSIDDVRIGKHVVIEEVDRDILHSCIGLEHLVETEVQGTPTVIMDNHNHALAMRARRKEAGIISPPMILVHIDQHADMGVPESEEKLTPMSTTEDITAYAHDVCNVGNFIMPAQAAWLISEIIQIRTVSKLLETGSGGLSTSYILDIDIDFWSSHTPTKQEKNAIDGLIAHASCCTVALSPYFMPLEKSIAVMRELL